MTTTSQPSTGTASTNEAATSLDYFPRRLRISGEDREIESIDEAGLLAIAGPKIVLGEPGMGKSELISELGRRLDSQPVTAVRFMLSSDPTKFAAAGRPVLIDALDEAMARREGDAVDMTFAQLEHAGSPDFILSCRAREWQSRSVTNLRQIYGADPTVLTLEPLNREEAGSFLGQRYAKVNPEQVLNHLDEHGIADLYGNPLTLGLMGQVAEQDTQLPATRASLFERVCTLIWPEHDPDRQDGGLGKISKDQALSAAGAIMAGLMLSGAEAASLSGPGQLQDTDVRLAELETLPGAGAAQAIFSSKLFHSIGIGRAKPIHRVLAEFLGARWLAQQSTTTRTQRRLLAQFQGSGGVPASLRGLHAWLAFHSAAMAGAVIATDPFGVLRYGETADLTAKQADCLFDALQALAEVDPYFRAQDWDSHTAAGLMLPNLRAKIETTIASHTSNGHLRSLLIEALKGTPIARDLANTLETVLLSPLRFYRERREAAQALMPLRDRAWWQQATARLRDQCTVDSARLARELIEQIDCDVTDELLVATLFAEMGLTICPLPRTEKSQSHTFRHYNRLIEVLPTARLINVLNLISDYAELVRDADWWNARDLAKLVCSLTLRAIDERVVLAADAAALWKWLGAVPHIDRLRGDEKKSLQARLDTNDGLRRAVQQHALYNARPHSTIRMSEIELARRMVGLGARLSDVTWFLDRLDGSDNKDPALREDWQDLVWLGIRTGGSTPEFHTALQNFPKGDAQLEAFLRKLQNPKKPAWERKRERDAAKQERKRRIALETDRRYFKANEAALRAGELRAIVNPARAYLGLFRDTVEQPVTNRIADWLGTELAADATAGFEAVLHRRDIPSSAEVAQSFAERRTWNYCFPIMAGLLARRRRGQGLADLSPDIRLTGLLLCRNDGGMCDDSDVTELRDELERLVLSTAQDREDFARLWIEPSLVAGSSHVSGIYTLAHDEAWHEAAATLVPGWLTTFINLPENVELELVDCLTHSGALAPLASIAAARATTVFRNCDHMLAWLAIDLLVRFELVLPDISGIGTDLPEFIWFLRNRFQLNHRGPMLPVSPAQAKWVISQFRAEWPYAVLVGSGAGNTNPYDATDFLVAMINRIANDTSLEATEAMQALIAEPADTYSDLIRHMASQQHQKHAEQSFAPLPPEDLRKLLTDGPPSNVDDLKSLVLEEMAVAQKILIGDDVDQVRDFWGDSGIPYDENRCRDRLAAMIGPELMRYDVQRITEADMPKTKRADLAFARGQIQLPMEVKGQWHPEVWRAAVDQLNTKYLIDWRSEQRGIYCVLWFGDLPSASGRRLQSPPAGIRVPSSAGDMRDILIEQIPQARRGLIDVVVLDLTAGKP